MFATPTATYNNARAGFFVDRMHSMLNESAAALLVSIGHRCGLFETMAELGWVSSERLATLSDLSESYVQEWLRAMHASAIIEYDGATDRYILPAEHCSALTGQTESANIAALMQQIPLLAAAEDEVSLAFRHGSGVHPRDFPRFQAVIDDVARELTPANIDDILSFAPELTKKLTEGISVLDIGCGSGQLVVELARRFPRSTFTGIDISPEAIRRARKAQLRSNADNVTFEPGNALQAARLGSFELVLACSVIRDGENPAAMLTAIEEALVPGGWLLIQEARVPDPQMIAQNRVPAAFLLAQSCILGISHSLALGGDGMGSSLDNTRLRHMLQQAGFQDMQATGPQDNQFQEWTLARAAGTSVEKTEELESEEWIGWHLSNL